MLNIILFHLKLNLRNTLYMISESVIVLILFLCVKFILPEVSNYNLINILGMFFILNIPILVLLNRSWINSDFENDILTQLYIMNLLDIYILSKYLVQTIVSCFSYGIILPIIFLIFNLEFSIIGLLSAFCYSLIINQLLIFFSIITISNKNSITSLLLISPFIIPTLIFSIGAIENSHYFLFLFGVLFIISPILYKLSSSAVKLRII